MKSEKRILIRAHLFKWWSPEVEEIVDRYGSNIAWFHTKPKGGILTLYARFGDATIAKQITLLQIDLARFDIIAVTMRKMADQLRDPSTLGHP